MSDKDNSINSPKYVIAKEQAPDALHELIRQAEQALSTQQNNQNTQVKPKETKK
jgi:hypothetical protein